MTNYSLRFATFLAPKMFGVYSFIIRYIGRKLGCRTELVVGSDYDQMATDFDGGFICGLPYIELARRPDCPVEPLAAPVLQGNRYDDKPVYFSDIIVHRASPFQSFADLRGRSWAYNEPNSQSGYGITRYQLARLGKTLDYFSAFIESGFHERSIRMVCAGEVDASAIDSQVLQISLRDHPELAARLRVIESWGPSTIQPFVAGRHLPSFLRADLQSVLLEIAENPEAKSYLARGFVDRFVAVDDSSYNDLREMLAVADGCNVPRLTICEHTSQLFPIQSNHATGTG